MAEFIKSAIPEHLRTSRFDGDLRPLIDDFLAFCQARASGATRLSFAQFYRQFIVPHYSDEMSLAAIQDYMRKHHGAIYTKASRRL